MDSKGFLQRLQDKKQKQHVSDQAKQLAKKIKEQKYQEYTSDQEDNYEDENFGDVDEEDDEKLMEKYKLIKKKEEMNKTSDLTFAIKDNKI
jgi:hypothetical protein